MRGMKKILILTAFALASLAAAQTSTTTTTTDTTMPAMMEAPMMTPEESFTKAQEFAAQADVAYPISFYDRTLWKASVDAAYMAATGDTSNRDYTAYLGQLYTKTQWWINAYNVWANIGELTDAEKDWASLSAAKLAYIALARGDKATAKTYVDKGMAWKSTPSLMAIQARL